MGFRFGKAARLSVEQFRAAPVDLIKGKGRETHPHAAQDVLNDGGTVQDAGFLPEDHVVPAAVDIKLYRNDLRTNRVHRPAELRFARQNGVAGDNADHDLPGALRQTQI